MNARFDTNGNIVISGTVIGTCAEKRIEMVVDTGFSGDIVLPTAIACELGLEYQGAANVMLADGGISTIPLFLAKITFNDKVYDTTIFVLPNINESLLGMDLLDKFEVSFSRSLKKVTIKSLSEEGRISQLQQTLRAIVPR